MNVCFAFVFSFLLLPLSIHAQLVGKVVSVADGDTFTMLIEGNTQIKVRLHGVDCPEKNQDFGQVAKKFLSDIIYGKSVKVTEMDIDRYGRTIGMVMIDSINVNEALLKAGLAWHYKKYDQNPKWVSYEAQARDGKKGLWVLASTIPPWEFRQVKRQAK